ncbi:MAG TPA: hypothetical protein VK947_13310 [Planococcus sp. (in: firmicutes)]|nr:hypothetical protein [Planococcus sp. (in: firmicutes)]
MSEQKETFEFLMPAAKDQGAGQFSIQGKNLTEALPVSLQNIHELTAGLDDYHVDTIELHVTGVLKSGPLTQLFIGAEGEAGMKLVLKRNEMDS